MTGPAAADGGHSAPARYVVSDVHGYREDLVAALRGAGLLDGDEHWVGRDARLWVLGDLFDRGPDGVGAVDLLMRLEGEARDAGGAATLLLGNHEILALAMHHFRETVIGSSGSGQDFAGIWYINGGNIRDQLRLTDDHVAWLSSRDSVAVDEDLLLVHCDTRHYLDWGTTAQRVNDTVRGILEGRDLDLWWRTWVRYVSRYDFVGRSGPDHAQELLAALGGRRVVHGHSIISTLVGGRSADTTGPLLYAGGLALDIDGGHYDGGPLLLVGV